MKKIDINADLGEGAGFDEQIMPLVSSCSIACGGHYGSYDTMKEAVNLARKHNVKVGAHPSFPDKDGFGRKVVTLTKSELKETVLQQLLDFYIVCDAAGVEINHVKLHGALYNYAAKDAPTSDAVVEAIIASKQRPKLYVPHGSILHKKAENLLPLDFEAFIDRRYNRDGSLVERDTSEAVISDPQLAWKQLYEMVVLGKVSIINSEGHPLDTTPEIQKIPMVATTFCIHGDNDASVPILNFIHQQLGKHSITLI